MTESPADLKPTDTDPNLSDKNKDKQEQKLEPDPKALPAGQLLPGEAEGTPAPKPPFARIGGQVAKWWNNDESGKAPGDVMPPVVIRLVPSRHGVELAKGIEPSSMTLQTDENGILQPVDIVAGGPGATPNWRFPYRVFVDAYSQHGTGANNAQPNPPKDDGTPAGHLEGIFNPQQGGRYDVMKLVGREFPFNADLLLQTVGESASFDNPQGPSRVNDTGWMDIVEGAGKGKFKWRVLNGYVIVQPKLEWQNLDKNDAVGRWVRLVDIPKSVKVASRVSYPTLRLIPNRVDGAVEGDNSVVEIWPNNTVVMHATQGGGRIIPTVMAPVERPNQA